MKKLRYKHLILLWFLQVMFSPVSADVLVLVHGYASNAWSWERSGVARILKHNGWQQVGIPDAHSNDGPNKFYSVELPAHMPLMMQTRFLQDFLHRIRERHGDEKLVLAGHSAGGVVARLSLLDGNQAGVSTLITIASPHLGTPRAVQGLNIVDDKPFFCPGPGIAMAKSVLGGSEYRYLRDSRGALIDMLPQGSGTLLDWANHRLHPDIEYHAVVRQGGDELVPEFSQDLNQVPGLKGRSRVWLTRTGHGLNPYDGQVLLKILTSST